MSESILSQSGSSPSQQIVSAPALARTDRTRENLVLKPKEKSYDIYTVIILRR
jgi:hypothetical protein